MPFPAPNILLPRDKGQILWHSISGMERTTQPHLHLPLRTRAAAPRACPASVPAALSALQPQPPWVPFSLIHFQCTCHLLFLLPLSLSATEPSVQPMNSDMYCTLDCGPYWSFHPDYQLGGGVGWGRRGTASCLSILLLTQ